MGGTLDHGQQIRSVQQMLVLPAAFAAALTRRAALQSASAMAMTIPQSVTAFNDDVKAGLGQGGALRSDVPVSLTGNAIEVLITEPSYKELTECPKAFFIP